jgi:hypothetical protein
MIEPLTRSAVLQKVATIASELDQLRKTDPEMVSTPTASLKTMSTNDLRDRYWHLWLCNNPGFGVPRRLRATPDKSQRTRQVRAIRKNEMLRIARIVTAERQESLNMGKKYDSLFGAHTVNGVVAQTTIMDDKFEETSQDQPTVSVSNTELVPA